MNVHDWLTIVTLVVNIVTSLLCCLVLYRTRKWIDLVQSRFSSAEARLKAIEDWILK